MNAKLVSSSRKEARLYQGVLGPTADGAEPCLARLPVRCDPQAPLVDPADRGLDQALLPVDAPVHQGEVTLAGPLELHARGDLRDQRLACDEDVHAASISVKLMCSPDHLTCALDHRKLKTVRILQSPPACREVWWLVHHDKPSILEEDTRLQRTTAELHR